MSDTATDEENIPKELMELDMRTMKRFMVQDREESDEEDKWEDESEDDK